jgi:hypothetical protein
VSDRARAGTRSTRRAWLTVLLVLVAHVLACEPPTPRGAGGVEEITQGPSAELRNSCAPFQQELQIGANP